LWGSPFKVSGHPFSFSYSAAIADGRLEMSLRNLGDFAGGIGIAPMMRMISTLADRGAGAL
jgi:predicted ferric reductase